MTCDELKTLAQSGSLEAKMAEPEVRAHLAQCAECEALYGAGAQVAKLLVAGTASPGGSRGRGLGFELGDLDALRSEVNDRLGAEASAWNGLRDRPTAVRRAVVMGAVVVLFGWAFVWSARADLPRYPVSRLLLELGLLFALLGVAVWEASRPLTVPLGDRRRIVVVLCILAPVALALGSSLAPVNTTTGTVNPGSIARCLLWGTAMALPAAFVLWLALRDNPWEGARLPLVAATSGLVGNLLLQVHCPSTEFGHLIGAHAPLLVVFALGCVLWSRVANTDQTKSAR